MSKKNKGKGKDKDKDKQKQENVECAPGEKHQKSETRRSPESSQTMF